MSTVYPKTGTCYLLALEPADRHHAYLILGKWPTLAHLRQYVLTMGITTPMRRFAVKKCGNFLHLYYSEFSQLSLESLLQLFPHNLKVGGFYSIGESATFVAPDLFSTTVSLLITTVVYIFTHRVLPTKYLMIVNAWLNNQIGFSLSEFLFTLDIVLLVWKLLELIVLFVRWILKGRFATNVLVRDGLDDFNNAVKSTKARIITPTYNNTTHSMVRTTARNLKPLFSDVLTFQLNINLYNMNKYVFVHSPGMDANFGPFSGQRVPLVGNMIRPLNTIAANGNDEYVQYMNQLPTITQDNMLNNLFKQLYFENYVLTKNYCPKDIVVQNTVIGSDLEWLNRNMQNMRVVPGSNSLSPHALNAAFRHAHVESINRLIPPSVKVLVVGSNPKQWPIDGFFHLIPIIDNKDAIRFESRMKYVKSMRDEGKYVEYSKNRLEMVNGYFEIMVVVHSNYDIPIEVLFAHADRLGVETVYITTLHNLSLLEDAFGMLVSEQMKFMKFMTVNGIMIRFTHFDENQQVYEHNWDVVKSYLLTRRIKVSEGMCYSGEIVTDMPDSITLKFCKVKDTKSSMYKGLCRNKYANTFRWISLLSDRELKFPLFYYHSDVVMVPEVIYTHVMGMLALERKPNVESIVSTVRNLYGSWCSRHYHPLMNDYAQKTTLIADITNTMMAMDGWLKIRSGGINVSKSYVFARDFSLIDWFLLWINHEHRMAEYAKQMLSYTSGTFEEERVVDYRDIITILTSEGVKKIELGPNDGDFEEVLECVVLREVENEMRFDLGIPGREYNLNEAMRPLLEEEDMEEHLEVQRRHDNAPGRDVMRLRNDTAAALNPRWQKPRRRHVVREDEQHEGRRAARQAPEPRSVCTAHRGHWGVDEGEEEPAERRMMADVDQRRQANYVDGDLAHYPVMIRRDLEIRDEIDYDIAGAPVGMNIEGRDIQNNYYYDDDDEDNLNITDGDNVNPMPQGYDPDDVSHLLCGSEPKLLGGTTNVRDYSIVTEFEGIAHTVHELGMCYQSIGNHFINCIFRCPERLVRLGGLNRMNMATLINSIFKTIPMIIIKSHYYTASFDITERSSNYVVLCMSDNGFTRLIPKSTKSLYQALKSESYLYLDSDTIEQFEILTRLKPVPEEDGHCFYKAVLKSGYTMMVDPNDLGICPPLKIVALMVAYKVAIVTKDIIYVPRFYSPMDLSQAVFVQDTHAYNIELQDLMMNMNHFNILSEAQWSKSLKGKFARNGIHGEVRLAKLNHLDAEISKRMQDVMNDRMKSVYETILYNIYLERTLLHRFALIMSSKQPRYLRAITGYWLYNTRKFKFMNGKPPMRFSDAWDGERFVNVEYDKETKKIICDTESEIIIMSEDVSFLRERKIVDGFESKLEELANHDWDAIRVTLKDGVPGCGKTTSVINDHNPGVDLVCTAGKEANKDYLDLNLAGKNYYRTYDSALINPVPVCNRIFADEGLMPHAGDILLAAFKSRSNEIIIYGDSKQIPFINRAVGFSCNYHILTLNNVIKETVTHRLPKVMMNIMRNFYPTITTTSKIKGSVGVERIRTIYDIKDKYDMLLTFTQAEKLMVINDLKVNCVTVHESEGKTYKNVAVVRLVMQDNSIYTSEPHIIVSLSRHRERLHYYSMIEGDSIWDLITKGEKIEAERYTSLDSNLKPIKVYSTTAIKSERVKQKFKNVESFDCSEVCSFISQSCCYNVSYEPNLYYEIVKVGEPKNSNLEYDVSITEVQMTIDAIFERVDDEAIEALTMENIFPLEKEFRVDFVKLMRYKPRTSEMCTPVLKTPQPKKFSGSLGETIFSIRKRNLNPPIIHYARDPTLINEVADTFMETYIDESKLVNAMGVNNYENDYYFRDWWARRNTAQRAALNAAKLRHADAARYKSHVKPDLKPKLDNSHNRELIAGQVLTAHSPITTAKYSGVAKCFTQILKLSLRTKWIINDGLSDVMLSGHINKVLTDVDEFIPHEVDFSKFDKSQEEFILRVTLEIMRRMGVPKWFIEEWFDSHTTNTLVFSGLGISVDTKFQRRSGDVLTFLGNTLVAMVVLGYTHDYNKAYGGVFGGDDSLVFLHKDNPITDQSDQIAHVFNLTAKIEFFPDAIYFSSKFLIWSEGNWYLVPDPIKHLVRLGRHDMFCEEHVECYYESFKLNLRWLDNTTIQQSISRSICKRYERKFTYPIEEVDILIKFLCDISKHRNKFKSLFQAPRRIWKRKLPSEIREGMVVDKDTFVESEDYEDSIFS